MPTASIFEEKSMKIKVELQEPQILRANAPIFSIDAMTITLTFL